MARVHHDRKVGKNHIRNAHRKLNRAAKKGKLRTADREALAAVHAKKDKGKRKAQDAVVADWDDAKAVREEAEAAELDPAQLPASLLSLTAEPKSKRRRKGSVRVGQHGPNEDIRDAAAVEEAAATAEEEYEKDGARRFRDGGVEYSRERLKARLPIKTADGGLEARFTAVEEDEEPDLPSDLEEEEPQEKEETAKFARKMVDIPEDIRPAELLALRSRLLREHKTRIAQLCLSVVENPERQNLRIGELLARARGEEVEWIVREKVASLACASLLTLFTDILPGYRIRERTAAEKTQKMKKDTRAEIEAEESLLTGYKSYLQILEKNSKELGKRGADPADSRWKLGLSSLRCLCALLLHNPEFNYSRNIIKVVAELCAVPTLSGQVHEICCETLRLLFKGDMKGAASLDVVRVVNRLVKEAAFKLSPLLLEALLSLKIKEINKKDPAVTAYEAKEKERKRAHLEKVSKTDRKRAKQLKALETELRETEARESKDVRLRLHSQTMDLVFTAYFRVLKRTPTSPLLGPCLSGLSQFAHLLSLHYLPELIATLQDLVARDLLKPLESLNCIQTVFTILSGEGAPLSIDPSGLYRLIYDLLPPIAALENAEYQKAQYAKALYCLKMMLVDRRKQVTLSRVAGFVTRLSLLLFILPQPEYVKATLLFIRLTMLAHPTLSLLVEEEEEGGDGRWRPELRDPDHAAGLNATLGHMRKLNLGGESGAVVRNLLGGLPSTGPLRLPPALIQTNPWEIVESAKDLPPSPFHALTTKERSKPSGELSKLLWTKYVK